MAENLYAILQIAKDAAPAAVKAAHRRLTKIHHPDKGGEPDAFMLIQTAYRVLSDAAMRAEYDASGRWNEKALLSDAERVTQLLAQVYAEMLAAAPKLDRHTDLKKLMLDAMSARAGQLTPIIDDNAKRAEFLATLIGRIPHKSGASLFDQVTRDTIGTGEAKLAQFREEARILKMAMTEMKNFDSIFDAAAVFSTFRWDTGTGSTSTSGFGGFG